MAARARTRSASVRRRAVGEEGLSLAELMIALVLLGIVLSASASALIQFTRTAVDNERRVQATALMNRLHEELQAAPWPAAANYEDDLGDLLLDPDFDELSDDPTWMFDGADVVTLIGPGTGERLEGAPEVVRSYRIDDRDYDVIRLVTWKDQPAGIKRFTTIVRWRLYDRVYSERYVSERAATAGEAGDPERPRVIQFQVGPSPMELHLVNDPNDDRDIYRNADEIEVVVRFSEPVPAATLYFRSVNVNPGDGFPLVEREVPLTPYLYQDGQAIAFRTTIEAMTHTFPTGPRTFTVQAAVGSEVYSGTTSMEFVGGDLGPEDVIDDPDAPADGDPGDGGGVVEDPDDPFASLGDVEIASVSLSPTFICQEHQSNRLIGDVVVTATVSGLHPEAYNVAATYTADGFTRSEQMQPDVESFSGSAVFRLILPDNTDAGFRPKGNNDAVTTFVIVASRPGSDRNDRDETVTLSVRANNKSGC